MTMRKTAFAGITELDPGEGLSTDGGAALGRDRLTIDRLLRIGAKTHRHDGTAGLENPSVAPTAAVEASGGSIRADLTITVGYTLEDVQGGETELSPTVTVTTDSPVAAPTGAPVVALNNDAGTLGIGTYYYGFTITDGTGGETPLGQVVSVERQPGAANAQVAVSGLSAGLASPLGWKLYRAINGGSFHLLASGDHETDTFTDDGATEPDCTVHPPMSGSNTTGSTNLLKVTLPDSGAVGDAEFINVYATVTGEFGSASLLDTYPASDAGSEQTFTELVFTLAAPPDVNQSIGGAHKIDAEVDVDNLFYRGPVSSVGDLPATGLDREIRLVSDEGTFYAFDAGASGWSAVAGGVGGGGVSVLVPGVSTVLIEDDFLVDTLASDWTQTSTGADPPTVNTTAPGTLVLPESYPPVILDHNTPVGDVSGGRTIEGTMKAHLGTGANSELNVGLYDHIATQSSNCRIEIYSDDTVSIGAGSFSGAIETSLSELGVARGDDIWIRMVWNVGGVMGAVRTEIHATNPDLGGEPLVIHEDDVAAWLGDMTAANFQLYLAANPTSANWWVDYVVVREISVAAAEYSAEQLQFTAGSGIDIAVTGDGSGLVDVKLDVTATGGGSIEEVSDASGSVVEPSKIHFVGEHDVQIAVTETPSGTAQVTIGAEGLSGLDGRTVLHGTGAPGSGLGEDGDFYIDTAATVLYGPKTAGVWGAGVNLVGATGGTVEGLVVSDGDVSVETLHLTVVGGTVTDDGDASATLTVVGGGGGGARETLSDMTGLIAPDASAAIDLAAYAGQRIIGLETNVAANVRVYGSPDDRTADAGRPMEEVPEAPVKVMLDYITDGSAFHAVNPAVDAHNLENPVGDELFLAVWNLDAASADVGVDLLVQKTEMT